MITFEESLARIKAENAAHTRSSPTPSLRAVPAAPAAPTPSGFDYWPEPESVDAIRVPPIRLDGLPELLRRVVIEVSRQAQTPHELALGAALGTLSAATRGAYSVQVHGGWNAGPTLVWACALADSGERKDGALEPIVAPLARLESALAKELRRTSRTALAVSEKLEADADAAREAEDWDVAADLDDRARRAKPRHPLSYILDDATTEALGVRMTEQRGAAAIFSTEASAFRTVAGAYSDAGANVGLLNKAYDAKPYRDARIKRAPIHVDRPALTWCVSVQPEVLAGYADKDTEGSGFLARFLFLLPGSMVGQRSGRDRHVADSLVMSAWAAALAPLHAASWGLYAAMTEDPEQVLAAVTLSLDTTGQDLLADVFDDMELRKQPGGDLFGAGGWAEKHPARLARIAALFALLDNPQARIVSGDHVAAAITLHDSLLAHAQASMRLLRHGGGGRTPAQALHGLLPRVPRQADGTITTRDAWMAARGQAWAGSVDDVRAALRELAALGWLRGPAQMTGPRGGRPSEHWLPHPNL